MVRSTSKTMELYRNNSKEDVGAQTKLWFRTNIPHEFHSHNRGCGRPLQDEDRAYSDDWAHMLLPKERKTWSKKGLSAYCSATDVVLLVCETRMSFLLLSVVLLHSSFRGSIQ